MKAVLLSEKGKVHVELVAETPEDHKSLALMSNPALSEAKYVYSGCRKKTEASGVVVSKVSLSVFKKGLREDEEPYEGLIPLKPSHLKGHEPVKVEVKPAEKKVVVTLED